MSAITDSPRTTLKSHRVGMIFTALATLAVTAAAVLLITIPGAGTGRTVSYAAPATYAPLIQYHGTGAAPQTAATATAQSSGSAYLRAEHSYGMVP
jgi:hypothetical protein